MLAPLLSETFLKVYCLSIVLVSSVFNHYVIL